MQKKKPGKKLLVSYLINTITKNTLTSLFFSEKIAIMMSSLVTGLFSVYLLVSFVHLKIKASVSNMRPYWDSVEL